MVKHGLFHVHSTYSLNDSAMSIDEMLAKAKEIGAKNITLTDHGTLLGIEPFMKKGAEYKINTIPGVEAYLENREHLVLIAKDYDGYKAISKAMKEASEHIYEGKNKMNYPCMNFGILEECFEGNAHVVASSACIQGPIGRILLSNYWKEKEAEKLEKKIDVLRKYNALYEENLGLYNSYVEQIKEQKAKASVHKKFTNKTFQKKLESLKKKSAKMEEQDEKNLLMMEIEQMEKKSLEEEAALKIIDEKIERLVVRRKEYKKKVDSYKKKKEQYYALIEKQNKIRQECEKSDVLYKEAKEMAKKLKRIFPDFYLEVQNNTLEAEKICMPQIVEIAKELNIPLIAGCDAHMADHTDSSLKAREIVRFNYFNRHETLTEVDRLLYLKTDEELIKYLSLIIPKESAIEAVENTKILEECKIVFPNEKHYPVIKTGLSFEELLALERKKMISKGEWNNEYEQRLKYEIGIIKKMGYVDYHMVVRDFVFMARKLGVVPKSRQKDIPSDFTNIDEWLQNNNFRIGVGAGPGRGSAAGSLVCYMLKITNIDPIKYGLLFERFLNPERVSMPDIDSDIKTSLRPTIIRYVKWVYGENAVCSIATETTYAAKGAIQQAGRDRASEVLHPKFGNNSEYQSEVSKYMHRYVYPLSDLIPETPGITLAACEQVMKKKEVDYEECRIIWEHAKLIEGKISSTGVHAGGVVISDNDNINDYVPLAKNEELNVWVAQCDMIQIEEKGMLKMDILGLITLDIETDTLDLILQNKGIAINLDEISFEAEVFENIYSKGLTNSVFQFESSGMKEMLKKFKPSCIEDLIILVAMYRPGPMKYIQSVIDVKHGRKKITYKVPELESILSSTYGAIVFQEQVMLIFQKLAGYSLGQADMVRRAMSKKKTEKLKKEREAFVYGDESRNIIGCKNNGIDTQKAIELFDDILDFAKYAFNKSHAASYAIVSYQTAWLKYHYTQEFLCAMFNNKEQKVFAPIIEDCMNYGYRLLPPDINKSMYDFTIEKNDIRFGFKGIKGISDVDVINEIIKKRTGNEDSSPYASFTDFVLRTTTIKEDNKFSLLKKTIIENFIDAGVFDSLEQNREALMSYYELIATEAKGKTFSVFKENLFAIKRPMFSNDANKEYNREKEMELLNVVVSENELDDYYEDEMYGCIPISMLKKGEQSIFGVIRNVVFKTSKSGNEIAVLDIQGKKGCCKVIAMNELCNTLKKEKIEWKIAKIRGQWNESVLFARSIACLQPYIDQYSYECDTEEKTREMVELLEKDIKEKTNQLHILLFYSGAKDNLKRTTPYYLKKAVSDELIKKLGSCKKQKGLH